MVLQSLTIVLLFLGHSISYAEQSKKSNIADVTDTNFQMITKGELALILFSANQGTKYNILWSPCSEIRTGSAKDFVQSFSRVFKFK